MGLQQAKMVRILNETAVYPRIGATVEIPRLHWVLRGFYGHFFQPAPLETVSASVLNYASNLPSGQNAFAPVPSERDEEHQFGIQIPLKGWLLDVSNVKNRVNNFLDHSNLGESNMYFPIAVDGALVRSWEMTLRSPRLARIGNFHVTYANQIANVLRSAGWDAHGPETTAIFGDAPAMGIRLYVRSGVAPDTAKILLDAFTRFDIPFKSGTTSNDMIPDNTTVELFVSHKP